MDSLKILKPKNDNVNDIVDDSTTATGKVTLNWRCRAAVD